ncbi:bifunctional ADP-dependent NAD(P)H-hydrate dehydratase/NAD(P)H-hydrate epimerase [Leptolyngbya iicbica LK]|uniref:Bifunctional NAD(P)H-hydrate repair enzyme n=3 Tax=Cyanophyceae TaxID=3028117 RepID=A0A4Q7DZT8_9CYAN|nr:bifunctional ADP-dependent NAD(P)H-hydrate dehydratase/NAD(P)H-hydrate epimerase [Leptolyngbya sp. LK]
MHSPLRDQPDFASSVIVTAQQMQAVEATIFAEGMPVAALMEKVAGKVARWIMQHFPRDRFPLVGCIVGPGHNGGDALVVARELHHRGYQMLIWYPFAQVKELTAQHKAYLEYLGVRFTQASEELNFCDLLIDGGFGLGLTRPLTGELATGIRTLNTGTVPVVSIDLPSGLESNTGEVLGVAVQATHTLCLGLWKLGLLQDRAQPWVGQCHLIPFDVPLTALQPALQDQPPPCCLTAAAAIARLPLPRSPIAHKYTAGHALLIAGSRQYAGAALLAAQGALASGVGMLTLVVPESLRLMVVSQLPEALVIGATETAQGAIAALPDDWEWDRYDVVACGPGLTIDAASVVKAVLQSDRPLVLDADGLNSLAQEDDPKGRLAARTAPTLLTPHVGEFRRLFPQPWQAAASPSLAASQAAIAAHSTLILKGAISAIAHADGQLWFNPDSSAALARGGSGDVLTGLVTGLAAQLAQTAVTDTMLLDAAIAAVWWHAQTGRAIAAQQTELGCPASELAKQLPRVLAEQLQTANATAPVW